MQLDQAADQVETEAEPAERAASGIPGLYEDLEDMWQQIRRDALAVVANADHEHVTWPIDRDRERDVPSRGRVLDGVVEQVGHHLRQAGLVAEHPARRLGQLDRELVLALLE